MAAAQNRNKLVITSLLEPTRGCAGDGPRFAVWEACSASPASLPQGRQGGAWR